MTSNFIACASNDQLFIHHYTGGVFATRSDVLQHVEGASSEDPICCISAGDQTVVVSKNSGEVQNDLEECIAQTFSSI